MKRFLMVCMIILLVSFVYAANPAKEALRNVKPVPIAAANRNVVSAVDTAGNTPSGRPFAAVKAIAVRRTIRGVLENINLTIEDDILRVRNRSVLLKEKLEVLNNTLYMNTTRGRKIIKIMPDTASETAIQRLRLKNFTITLKDVGKPVYEVNGTKRVRFLGLFRVRAKIKARINAEDGSLEVVERPWWMRFSREE